jgi:hypothetical protein
VQPTDRQEQPVQFMLMIHINPIRFEALPEPERLAVIDGHADYQTMLKESGELVSFHGWGERGGSSIVRIRDGQREVVDAPNARGQEFLGGCYVVECATKGRAIELAALMPDARVNSVEVRPVPYTA